MADDNKPLLDQLREKRQVLLDEIAPAIEQREKERDEFAEREANLVGEATKAIEIITRDEAKDVEEKREAVKAADKPVLEARAAFTAAEEGFEADFDRRDKDIQKLTQRISEQEVIEFRKELASKASAGEGRITIGNEEKTYQREIVTKTGPSYFKDLTARSLPAIAGQLGIDPNDAEARLNRHAEEMDVELPKRQQNREKRAEMQVDNAEKEFRGSFVGMNSRGSLEASPFEKRITPNRTDGQGGLLQVAAV